MITLFDRIGYAIYRRIHDFKDRRYYKKHGYPRNWMS